MEKIKNIIIVLLIILFTISIVPKTFQNDTFFTIAIGRNILENGVEKQEKLVWHEGLEFTNSRWLFDTIIALMYNKFNFIGIYIFVLVIASFQALLYNYILNKIIKNKYVAFILTLLTIYFSSNEFTARAQIMSFLLFLIEFYCIERLVKMGKKIYTIILIIIPLILVNMHSSVFPMYFVFYLPYIAEFVLSKMKLKNNEDSKIIIENNNSIKKLEFLIIIGIILGFCTPDGLEPYSFMFKTMNGLSSEFIAELQSVNIFYRPYFSVLMIITIGIIGFTKTKIRLTDCLYILGFGLMGLYTYRCIFFFFLISSICIFRIINDCLYTYDININFNSPIYNIIKVVSFIVIFVISIKNISKEIVCDYVDESKYPLEVSNYILENIDTKNMKLYNHFNFGSYLEFRGIKTFIDSRSEMYTPEFNKDCTVLQDWYNVYKGIVNYREIFEKYGITHAILYKDEVANQYIIYDQDWKLIYDYGSFSLFEKVNK